MNNRISSNDKILSTIVILILVFLVFSFYRNAPLASISSLGDGRISEENLLSGGVPRDGIPSIDDPVFDSIEDTPFTDEEMIVGVFNDGEAKAYPYSILNWHEVVNDDVGGLPVSVSYCPLCDTSAVFVREINGEETTFGVSGNLYNSCLVLYDRETESLWVQPWGVSVFGEETNNELDRIPAIRTTLGQWREKYPDTQVLSTDTGHRRNYAVNPYGDYNVNNEIIFPARGLDGLTFHPKEPTHIVFASNNETPFETYGGDSIVVIDREVEEKGSIDIEINGVNGRVVWDDELGVPRAYIGDEEVPTLPSFGFVHGALFGSR